VLRNLGDFDGNAARTSSGASPTQLSHRLMNGLPSLLEVVIAPPRDGRGRKGDFDGDASRPVVALHERARTGVLNDAPTRRRFARLAGPAGVSP